MYYFKLPHLYSAPFGTPRLQINVCKSNIHEVFCLLLHVSAELRHLQGFFTPILKTDHV